MITGIKVLLAGPSGSGKSHSVRTLTEAGLNVFAIVCEAHSLSIIQEDPKAHYVYIPPVNANWDSLIRSGKLVNSLSPGKLLEQNPSRSSHQQFLNVLGACNNATCDRCSTQFGDITKLGNDWAIVIDSLSGLNTMAKALTIGDKPAPTQPEWGIMMSTLERFLDTLIANTVAHIVVIAHLESERDELSGAVKNMVSTLGRKLAPILPAKFSDFIRSSSEGNTFKWMSTHPQMDLKATHFPIGRSDLPPSFSPAIRKWQERTGCKVDGKQTICKP